MSDTPEKVPMIRARASHLLLGLVLGLAGPLAGQATDGSPSEAAAPADTAALTVLNRHIVTFRAPFLGRPPEARVAGARRRIAEAARIRPEVTLSAMAVPEGRAIRADSATLFILTPGDLDVLDDATLDETAAAAVRALHEAQAEVRNQSSVRYLARAVLLALLATVLVALALRGLVRLTRALKPRLEAFVERGAERTATIAGMPLVEPRRLRRLAARVVEVLMILLGIMLGYLWLTFVLGQFPFSRPWGQALGGFLLERVQLLGRGIAGAVPGLITVVIIYLVARWCARVVNTFFDNIAAGRTLVRWVHPDTALPTRRLMVVVVWLFALVAAYPYLPGSDSAAFKGLSVILGLMISLGSGSLIGQALSGLSLMYARSIRPGEYVRVDDVEGTVETLGLFATKLRNPKGEEVSIPNGVMLSTKTTNYTRLAGTMGPLVYSTVTIGYDAPWRQVEAMLLEAARRTAGLKQDPPPFVLQLALSDYYPEYQVNARIEQIADKPQVMSRLHAHIQDVFNEHGVQIMSPHYRADKDEPVVVPRERWYEPPATRPES